MALALGMDESGAEHVAIVTTEACTNLLKHASGGQILLQTSTEESDAAPLLELLAVDQGPGMSNLDQCLRDGYSTGSSPGQGLGAIQRMSKQSDIYTLPGKGTVVLARWWLSRNGANAIGRSRAGRCECFHAWRRRMRRFVGLGVRRRGFGNSRRRRSWGTGWKPGSRQPKPSGSSMNIRSCRPKPC